MNIERRTTIEIWRLYKVCTKHTQIHTHTNSHIHTSLIRNHRRMPRSTRNIHNTQSHQRLHPPWCRMPTLIPMSQLAIHASTPLEQIPIARNRRSMIRTTSNMRHNLPRQRVRQPRHVLPSVIPVSQLAVVAPSPGVDLPFSG